MNALERPGVRRAAAALAIAFGIATLASGGRVLFGGEAARQAAGAVVPWVLWFNFGAGFAYVAAGVGMALRRAWAAPLALAIALASAIVLAALGAHAALGGAYEARTAAAMVLRCVVWIGLAWWAWRVAARPAARA
jgi:hypothetical protein